MRKYLKSSILAFSLILLFLGFIFVFFIIRTQINAKKDLTTKAVLQYNKDVSGGCSRNMTSIISNQWYSSLYNKFPTEPLFAYPVAYQISQKGLTFSYPNINPTKNTIFGSFQPDFTIGSTGTLSSPTPTCAGDWDISLSQTEGTGNMRYTLAQGIPYTIIHNNNLSLLLSSLQPLNVMQLTGSPINPTLKINKFIVEINSHAYIIILPTATTISIANNQIALGDVKQVFVGLLDKVSNYKPFLSLASSTVINTHVTPTIVNNKLKVTYTITTSSGSGIMALFPHQYDNLTTKPAIIGTYQSIRGPLHLYQMTSFTQETNLITPPDNFSPLLKSHPDLNAQIKKDIASVMKQGPPNSTDYYLGTWFGKVDNLLLLADTLRMQSEEKMLLSYVEPIFHKSLSNFYYDSKQNSIIAKNPEFGNQVLNDHHFHYGYYIRTGAVLAKLDPSTLADYEEGVNQLVDDIMTTDRKSTQFPFLRNFDIYESHSWADGYAGFADGNNQESSSEAINAWYGIYLWSGITHNTKQELYSLYLYNSEILGAKYYWFDIKNLYKQPYQHAIASIVWGGKVDFATWFSADVNMIYGIQLLPLTPASDYLGTLPDFAKYDKDYHANGGSEYKSWGDLFAVWKSFYDPSIELSNMNKINNLESDNTKSVVMYFLYKNAGQ